MQESNKSERTCALTYHVAAGILAFGVIAPGITVANIDIVFDYRFDTSGFFTDEVKNILDDAASFFETYIEDDLTAISNSGGNTWSAVFSNPSTGEREEVAGLDVAADTLVVFVGARDLGSSLGLGGPGGFSARGSGSFFNNIRTRGEAGATFGPDATDFAPWGGILAFNTESNWYFDTDTSTDEAFRGVDFFSVALHELGHVFGLGISDSWDNQINENDQFVGVNAVAEHGGPVQLTASGGHWDYNTQSSVYGNSLLQEAALDPNITVGTRKRFTDLDVAGLADIGWEIAAASSQ